jgi:hypothetical protein
LTIAPNHPELLNNLAVLLALHRRDASGRPLEFLDTANARAGPTATLQDSRAVVHHAAARFKEAERDLRVAPSLDDKPVYHFHLAQLYFRLAEQQAEFADRRDDAVRRARSGGLSRGQLHPLEWTEYEKLFEQKQ